MCNRVAFKVQKVLNVSTDMYAIDFLEKIMEDYNYLSTREYATTAQQLKSIQKRLLSYNDMPVGS